MNNFVYSLRELEKLEWIKKVDIRIVMLPLGRRFSYLSNGVDRRKCLIAELLKTNGDVFGIIEVQRQGKLLSTLILKEKSSKRLRWACEELSNGLVRESGKWSNASINNIVLQGITIKRVKHVGRNKYDKAKHIESKIH